MALLKAKVVVDTRGLAGLVTKAKERSITLRAVKAGARLVQADAKAAAPRRKGSGALRQSLGTKAVKGTRGSTVALAVVGARKKVVKTLSRGNKSVRVVPAFYAHLVEKGTRPHAIGKGSKLGRKGKASGPQAGGMHPGAKAQPFLVPAWESNRSRAAEEAKKVLADEIQKAIAKAAASQAKKPKG